MPGFRRFWAWLHRVASSLRRPEGRSDRKGPQPRTLAERPPPPPTYLRLIVVAQPPQPEEVEFDAFFVVQPKETPKWVMFRCPCPSREVITLSLQDVHKPRWLLRSGKEGRPTLHPSVWRTEGCRSHFWVKDGGVYWT